MNKIQLENYLEAIDQGLSRPATLVIYGSAAFMLLGEETRTSLDIDVAGPYSDCDISELREAAAKAGVPVNPDTDYESDHIEWVSGLRLCLPKPDPLSDVDLWQGQHLKVKTVAPAKLIASKLIRYDFVDQSDVHFLYFQAKPTFNQIESAVKDLPDAFSRDVVVTENIKNLKADIALWEASL